MPLDQDSFFPLTVFLQHVLSVNLLVPYRMEFRITLILGEIFLLLLAVNGYLNL